MDQAIFHCQTQTREAWGILSLRSLFQVAAIRLP